MGKNLALWVIIAILLVALFNLFQSPSGRSSQSSLAFSDFLAEVDSGQISEVTIQGNNLTAETRDGRSVNVYTPDYPNLVEKLNDKGVRIIAQPEQSLSPLMSALISWFPMLLIIGVWIFFMRQMQGG
ncbi:MAG TPA: cell division protein FtsH, partial [Thalassospira sp.]|nr:cell division protein FtsH [Thalassospira sp.]